MDIVLLIMGTIIIVLMFVLIIRSGGKDSGLIDEINRLKSENAASDRQLREEVSSSVQSSVRSLGEMLASGQKSSGEAMNSQLTQLEARLRTLEANNEQKLDAMRSTISRHLTGIQEENHRKLSEIQSAVNEKLESKMTESFRLVSERLEQVYKGLGEMQTVAAGVGDLKKVLSNVKNRGILGEIQLGAILEDILAPEQYDTDTATIPGSTNRVEFAVKLPSSSDSGHIYLPIDSKFPGDTYSALQDALESGDQNSVSAARKELETAIKKAAKDIRDKYVQPPYTTGFGIMFLPFEGLYAEIVNSGLIDTLRRDFNISVCGPSTMAAMLNSLQMGFRTLAIQKKSNQVWEILGAVKSEFQNFSKVLEDTQKHIKKVDDDLEKLVGVRTRQINRRLSAIESADSSEEE
ncbi:MAG TPA: DNA recombination protein RmuC [Ruminococcus sp.]|nr:DNA recombination protein RmuC [Ruminococcus sp.]